MVTSAVAAWIRTTTQSEINEEDAAAYAQHFADLGYDSVELLAGAMEDFDKTIGERLKSVMHRRLLRRELGQLAAAAPAAAEAPRAADAEDFDVWALLSEDFDVGDEEEKSPAEIAAERHAEAWAWLASEQVGMPLTVVVHNAFTGVELCTLQVAPQSTLKEIAVLARVARLEAKPLDANLAIVFVGQGRVMYDRLTLGTVFPRAKPDEPLALDAVEQDVERASNALLKARGDHILASAQDLQRIPDTLFGAELAGQLHRALSRGRGSEGRVEFCTQEKGYTRSTTDTWQLSRNHMTVNRVDTTKLTIPEQIARLGHVRIVTHEEEAYGDIMLTVAGQSEFWRSKDAFVEFWSSMSERRIAACFLGLWLSNEGILNQSEQQARKGRGVTRWVTGTPTMRHLQVLASR